MVQVYFCCLHSILQGQCNVRFIRNFSFLRCVIVILVWLCNCVVIWFTFEGMSFYVFCYSPPRGGNYIILALNICVLFKLCTWSIYHISAKRVSLSQLWGFIKIIYCIHSQFLQTDLEKDAILKVSTYHGELYDVWVYWKLDPKVLMNKWYLYESKTGITYWLACA